MSRYSGQQDFSGPLEGRRNKGVARETREQKRREAEERNARTPGERRRKYREGDPGVRLLVRIFEGSR